MEMKELSKLLLSLLLFGPLISKVDASRANSSKSSRPQLQLQGYFLPENVTESDTWSCEDSEESKRRQEERLRQNARGCLEAHNRYRHLHRTPELYWCDELAAFAQSRSNDMATNDYFAHVPNTPYGENLAFFSRKDTSCDTMVKAWYDEHQLYNYFEASFSSATGHFTQVVWRNTRSVGCAFATSARGLYLTCNYDPPGNVIGQFWENVPRPITGRKYFAPAERIGSTSSSFEESEDSLRVSPVPPLDDVADHSSRTYKGYMSGRTPRRQRPWRAQRPQKNWVSDAWWFCLSGHCRPRGK